jgi:hypothetical protein
MNADDTIKIIKEFSEFIGRNGDDCSQWRVGVSTDAEHHLFNALGLPPKYPWCLYRRAANALDAYSIAKAFWNIECVRNSDASDQLDEQAVYVFAYREDGSFASMLYNRANRPQLSALKANS